MILKRLLGLVFVGGLAFCATASAEERPPAPSRNHVWISGYHRWDGNAYAWNEGRWEVPPQPHQRWVAHHWVHRSNGYVLVDGRWR